MKRRNRPGRSAPANARLARILSNCARTASGDGFAAPLRLAIVPNCSRAEAGTGLIGWKGSVHFWGRRARRRQRMALPQAATLLSAGLVLPMLHWRPAAQNEPVWNAVGPLMGIFFL